jgi:transcriptional regulator with GAF, ATPase, and Fis domain
VIRHSAEWVGRPSRGHLMVNRQLNTKQYGRETHEQEDRHHSFGSDGRAGKVPLAGQCAELQNGIERAVITSIGPGLKLAIEELHLRVESKEAMRTHTQPQPLTNCGDGNLRATLKDAERQDFVAPLEKTTGRVAGPHGAAALLGRESVHTVVSNAEARH